MTSDYAQRARIAILILCALAVVAALEYAQPLLAPTLSAVVVGVVLSPLADLLCRFGVRPAAAAFAVLFVFLITAVAILLALGPSVSAAVDQAPIIWFEFQAFLDVARQAVSGLRDFQETVSDALEPAPDVGAEIAEGDEEDADLPIPNVFDALSYGPAVIGAILIFVGTLYFFLASRIELYRQLSGLVSGLTQNRLLVAERQVAKYFLTITCINATFGILVTIAMMMLGMPQPAVWGIATFLLNFLLYLGPALVAVALIVVGVVTFDGALSFAPVAIFVALNLTEAQFVTPTLVGQHMKLNPLVVFLSLIAWLWLWGPIGGLVAIPLLVWSIVMFGGASKTGSQTKSPG